MPPRELLRHRSVVDDSALDDNGGNEEEEETAVAERFDDGEPPGEETPLLLSSTATPIHSNIQPQYKLQKYVTRSTDGSGRRSWTMNLPTVRREVLEQSKTFLPALQSFVLSKIPWFVTIRILATLDHRDDGGVGGGGVELAGAALATTLCNVTGMSLCVGFSFALSTLAGQAKGEMVARGKATATAALQSSFANDRDDDDDGGGNQPSEGAPPNTPIVFWLRGLLIQQMLVIPVGIWWMSGIEEFLVDLGQTRDLADHAGTYLALLAPSLWLYSIQWTTSAWANSIGMADVPARAALLGAILHVPFNLLFCYVLGMGYLGCAHATTMFQAVQCSYTLAHCFGRSRGRKRVLDATGGTAVGLRSLTLLPELKIAGGSLRGFAEYLGLALPGLVIISEWWASEAAIFLSGKLHPDPQIALAAMTIYQSINSFCFMIPCGFSIAGMARVGNLLGAGDPDGASLACKISVGLCTIGSGALGVILYMLPHGFVPGLFVSASENMAIIEQTAATIPLLAVYVFADGIQMGLNGVIKGCGRQKVVVPIVVFAYWVVGVPLAYYFGLYRSGSDDAHCAHNVVGENYDDDEILVLCGDVGLVAGMTVGTWCHMLLLLAVVVGTTDWKEEAYKAKERVAADRAYRDRKKRRKQRKEDTELESQHARRGSNKKDLRCSRSDGYLN